MQRAFEVLLALCLCVGLGASALAQTASSGRDLAPLVAAFDARIAALRDQQRSLPPPANLEESLQRLKALDAAVRNGKEMAGLSQAERLALQKAIDPSARRVELENTAVLRTLLPPEGWFRLSREGFAVSSLAWVIVQHSPDAAFQKEILAKMEPMFAQGDVDPQSYAMLYDQVHLAESGKQRFGTQAVCRDGRMVIADMDEPEKVQERRNAVGLKAPPYPPFEEFAALFANMRC